ncbi:MAG TPA: selenocysteine-specific translation elongation factor [Dehalococcoidia bacterium]|nr:selenocysteine-specific translation elongation factor [Dehalococcoidia bacterium]
MYVIGTAGHVDHGKSTLVQALTGIDPDRWEEEKRRGLTIDLGFAWLTLPSGKEVSIVDVPGHERFIKNMLAGVGGIDLALLVIAADEGVMPQTREHLAIIDLLEIERGVVALTKADLTDAEMLALAEADAREALAGTTLSAAPIVPCSGTTRDGLDALVAAIETQFAETQPRHDTGRPRLPIDRAFTMPGFGTVVTGTLIDGALRTGDQVEVLPGNARARIRGLQMHGRAVALAEPGRRTAVNLSGIAVDDLHRGMVLARPGTVRVTTSVDVQLKAVPYLGRVIRHNLTVTFHTGSAEVEGKLLLLDTREVAPGAEVWAQIRLATPAIALPGDRFIVRDPNDTLGGGSVVVADAPRHRRFDADTIAQLERLAVGSPEEALLASLGAVPVPVASLDAAVADSLVASGRLLRLDSCVVTRPAFDALSARVQEVLSAYHAAAPLRPGMPREEMRSRLALPADAYDALIVRLADDDIVVVRTNALAISDHEPALSPEQQLIAERYVASLRATPYSPPTDARPDDDLLALLESRGEVVPAGDGVVFAAEAYREMLARIQAHLEERGKITLSEARDMFGTSRKYAQALLEHLDAKRVTRRVGDERVPVKPP